MYSRATIISKERKPQQKREKQKKTTATFRVDKKGDIHEHQFILHRCLKNIALHIRCRCRCVWCMTVNVEIKIISALATECHAINIS